MLLFLVPLVPALVELTNPTDVAPLKVAQEYNSNIQHFADGFRKYIEKSLSNYPVESGMSGILVDGTHFEILNSTGRPMLENRRSTKKIIYSYYPMQLPDNVFFESEIYSKHTITAGHGNNFRALLAEESIHLGENSTIIRWVHSENAIKAGSGSMLLGRCSAKNKIFIAENCYFERLHAPYIELGRYEGSSHHENTYSPNLIRLIELKNVSMKYDKRAILSGSLDFPERNYYEGDIVAKDVRIGAGSHIKGSIKSNGDFYIDSNVKIEGSITSTGNIYINNNCYIKGPVIAENTIVIGSGTIIGSENINSTITAPYITSEGGVIVYGTIWAKEQGTVKDKSFSHKPT